MKFTLFSIAVGALLLGITLYRRRKTKRLLDAIDNHHTISTFEPGGDPIQDRTEFHFTQRR